MQKKSLFIVLVILAIFLINFASAIDLEIEKKAITDTIIREISQAAVFNFTITNHGESDDFEIYSLVGVDFSPKGTFYIAGGQTKIIPVMVYPKKNLRADSGFATFAYKIRGINTGIQDDKMTIKIVDFKDALDIYTDKIHPDNQETTLYIENKENYNFPSISLKISSVLFSLDTALSLNPLEKKDFIVNLDEEKLKTLIAGQYTMKVSVSEPIKQEIETSFEVLEKKYISVREIKSGLLIREKHVVKTNEGSIPVVAEVKDKKNIITRLFTSFNILPDQVERKGVSVYYTWKKEINPSESLDVNIKTNYTFPFLLIAGLVIIIWIVRISGRKDIDLEKRVSFVKTTSGTFALRVKLKIKANKYIEKVSVIDKLPPVVKLLEKFSSLSPDKIDSLNRRLIWNFSNLAEGEERVMSYIVYSKLAILGKFELPPAVCIYEIEDKVHEQASNKAFFVAEQKVENE